MYVAVGVLFVRQGEPGSVGAGYIYEYVGLVVSVVMVMLLYHYQSSI